MAERPKTVDEARSLLREAIDNSHYKGNVSALTWKLWRGKRGKDFIRDFLNGRKGKLGGAAETAAVENELILASGTLAVAIEESPQHEYDNPQLAIIQDSMKLVACLIDPANNWTDTHFRLAARLFQEFLSDKQSLGEDPETHRLRLEIAIRRAFQKESL